MRAPLYMLGRSVAPSLVAVCALAALVPIGCGGLNTSDQDRRGRIGDVAPSDDDGGPTDTEDPDAGITEVDSGGEVVLPKDAGAGDAAPVVPEGSFAIGTELETTSGLNLREGPGTQFAVVVLIPIASRVKVEKVSGADGWVNVAYAGQVGFASKMFLKVP